MAQAAIHPAASFALVCGAVCLVILIVPARLLHLKSLQKYRTPHLWLARQGKWLGLLTALCFGLHGVLMLPGWRWSAGMVLLTTCLGILALLSVISNSWSYFHIKHWKHLNMLVWLVVPLTAVYAVVGRQQLGNGLAGLLCVLLVVCAAAGVGGLFEPKPGYFARHRVWLMAIGLIFGLAIVWWWPAG